HDHQHMAFGIIRDKTGNSRKITKIRNKRTTSPARIAARRRSPGILFSENVGGSLGFSFTQTSTTMI
ncbi:hypothetical protein, partial [Sneathiella sp.]|uniref:hypothetical protein n=1 Tax=Sneathiella sp. TaxID=1964365 RepID=UPI00260D29FE